jgi:hypothetical protein
MDIAGVEHKSVDLSHTRGSCRGLAKGRDRERMRNDLVDGASGLLQIWSPPAAAYSHCAALTAIGIDEAALWG